MLTLVIGLGSTVAMYAVVAGVLLRPLPYGQPDRLVGAWHDMPSIGSMQEGQTVATYFAYRRLARTIEVYAELDRRGDMGAQLDLLAADGVPAKYRTGGVTRNAVPPAAELASFI